VNGTKGKVIGFYLSKTNEYYYNGEDEQLVDKTVLPIVKFINGIVRIMDFEKWSIEDSKGNELARFQVLFLKV